MPDIVIPLCTTYNKNNIELRYALRSIEKNLTGIGNIYIVGLIIPKWIKNIIHLPFKDLSFSLNKEWNIYSKLLHACNQEALTADFIHMHDDHFVLQPFEADKFPVHHKGLMNTEKRNQSDSYRKTLENTLALFPNTNNFNVHSPILYNKQKFLDLKIDKKPFGYALKTLYCNTYGIKGEYLPDCKIGRALKAEQIIEILKNRPYFSTDIGAFDGDMATVLQEMFQGKSKWEC